MSLHGKETISNQAARRPVYALCDLEWSVITIEMTKSQDVLVQRALALCTRTGQGRFEAVADELIFHAPSLSGMNDQINKPLYDLKKIVHGHGPYGGFGIYSREVPVAYRNSFDLSQDMQSALGGKHPPAREGIEGPCKVMEE